MYAPSGVENDDDDDDDGDDDKTASAIFALKLTLLQISLILAQRAIAY